MIQIAPDIWDNLIKASPEGGNLTARLGFPDITNRLYMAVDVEKKRHLLVILNPNDKELHDAQSRGLLVNTRDLEISGRGISKYIDIECCDIFGYDALDFIGAEIADGLKDGKKSPADIVMYVLSKWRHFWGQTPRSLLSREEQLGLFAELWFLLKWLMSSIDVKLAIERWKGPSGARHDFEWLGCSVEVKATTSSRGRIHHINGIEQLANPVEGKLLFFSVRLQEEGGALNTLPALAKSCRELLLSSPESLSRFESCLVQAGYSLVYESEYSKMRLRVTEEVLFKVEGNFPRITPDSFPAGVPSGVEHIEYEVNLAGYEHLLLAKSASECPPLN